jgi:hypothetical protein
MDWTPTRDGKVLDVPCGEPSELTAEIDGVTYKVCRPCATFIARYMKGPTV